MGAISLLVGSKEHLIEDIKIFSETLTETPEVQLVSKKDLKDALVDKASTLFIDKNLVFVIIDPDKDQLAELKGYFQVLKDKINIIIYLTTPLIEQLPLEGVVTVVFEKEREKRIKERVLSLLKRYGKVMTDKGFDRLKEKIRDESILESEIMKLINFVGERREIKSSDVEAIVTETHEENLLTFFETIAKGDKKGIFDSLENYFESGLNVLAIQAFLIRQTRLMLQGKDMEELFKIHKDYNAFLKVFNRWKESSLNLQGDKKHYLPFQNKYYAYKLVNTGLKFSREALVDMLKRFAYVESKLKSGTRYDRIYLEQSLIEV